MRIYELGVPVHLEIVCCCLRARSPLLVHPGMREDATGFRSVESEIASPRKARNDSSDSEIVQTSGNTPGMREDATGFQPVESEIASPQTARNDRRQGCGHCG